MRQTATSWTLSYSKGMTRDRERLLKYSVVVHELTKLGEEMEKAKQYTDTLDATLTTIALHLQPQGPCLHEFRKETLLAREWLEAIVHIYLIEQNVSTHMYIILKHRDVHICSLDSRPPRDQFTFTHRTRKEGEDLDDFITWCLPLVTSRPITQYGSTVYIGMAMGCSAL